jgi:CRP-like cAMP-binding protein
LKKLEKGNSFGEVGFFTGKSRNFTLKSQDFSTLLFIDRNEFIDLLQRNLPEDYEKFCDIKDSIKLNEDYS